MSKYQEMCDAAAVALRTKNKSRPRCLENMAKLVNGFITYCEVPRGRVIFLRWNGAKGVAESRYKATEGGQPFSLPHAMVLDEENGYWNLGVRIVFSSGMVFFVLCVSEYEGKPRFKTTVVGKPHQVDLDDPSQCNEFYDDIVESIKQSFRDPGRSSSTPIGFRWVPNTDGSEAGSPPI